MVRFTAETNAGKTFGHTPTAQQRKNDDTAAQARTQKRQPDAVHPALVALRAGRLGVTFSGAGFGAAYQLGAAEMLTNLGVLCAQTPVAGCSAGGFVAAACRCSIPFLDVLSALKQASSDLIEHGQNGRLRSTLEPLIQRLIPDNAHEQCTGPDALPFVLSATRVRGPCPVCWAGDLADTGFSSKQELINRLLAGAHEPIVSDGRCMAQYHGGRFIDGGLRVPVPPIPGVDYTLIVYPVANQLLNRLWPYKLLMHPPPPEAIAISPGQYTPWPHTKSYRKANHLVMHPQPPEVLNMLFERGRRDALAWAQYVGLASALPAAATAAAAAATTPAGATGKCVAGVYPPATTASQRQAQEETQQNGYTDSSSATGRQHGRGGDSSSSRHGATADASSHNSDAGAADTRCEPACSSTEANGATCSATGHAGRVSNAGSNFAVHSQAMGFSVGTGNSVAGSEPGAVPHGRSRVGDVWDDVQLDQAGDAAATVRRWQAVLATPVSQLPMLVDVPEHLLHMLA